jgi:glycosyltransferase involved in cell wall biosynthesis
VVVSDRHARAHPGTAARIGATPNAVLHVAQLPDDFDEALSGTVARDRLHGRLAADYIRRLHPDHFVLMLCDHAQLSLAFDLRFGWPLAISGIYFRPSFHYGRLGGPPETTRDRVKGLTKQVVLRAALRNPHFRTLFSLDPFAVPQIARWSRHTEIVALPEPLDHGDTIGSPSGDGSGLPLLDGLEPGRRRLVIFGSLDEKKGIGIVLDALQALPSETQQRLALILGGPVGGYRRDELLARIVRLDAQTGLRLRLEDRFIPEEDVQPLLAACDLVLLTYQRHVGSSGVLIRAAAAGVPVLATDYGVVGEQVRRHRLGITVDATSSESIREALEAWIERTDAIPFDRAAAAAFSAENTADLFAETIFSRLLRSEGT